MEVKLGLFRLGYDPLRHCVSERTIYVILIDLEEREIERGEKS